MNKLFYGDNLQILREHISSESVDLIYLDPPFNSKADYNILYKTPNGRESQSQIIAFEDTWHWTEETERTFSEIIDIAPGDVVDMIRAFRNFVNENDMMAYLTMMTIRLLELRRVLKDTGSIYLHCDPTASHYLRMLMDTIYGSKNFCNEIIWHYRKWPTGKYTFQRNHDVIFFYSRSRSKERIFNQLYMQRAPSTLKRFGTSKIISGHDETGKRVPSKTESVDSQGVRMGDVWDIGRVPPIKQLYPTEKPLKLLERIIHASTNEGELVLDPFCGCGTTIAAAQHLKRKWIGIDVTHLAINLIKKRLFESEVKVPGVDFEVVGEPTSLDGAKELANQNKYQFQWWITGYIGARPYKGKTRGPDSGIDAIDYFSFKNPETSKIETEKVIISVKGGHVTVAQVRDLIGVVEREKAAMGFFVTLEPKTRKMEEEAVKAGFYTYPLTKINYRRIQILSVEEIMQGKKFDIPGTRVEHTKKAEYSDGEQGLLQFG